MSMVLIFFFQAEDGIRDLVRSRGLGDVYKRQITHLARTPDLGEFSRWEAAMPSGWGCIRAIRIVPVSYTHLTLPTSDLV